MNISPIWLLSNSTNSRIKEYLCTLTVVFYLSRGGFTNISEMLPEKLAKTSELGLRGPKS